METYLEENDRDVKRKILTAADAIRKKYLALKLDQNMEDAAIHKILNPFKEPLSTLIKATQKGSMQDKTERDQLKPLKRKRDIENDDLTNPRARKLSRSRSYTTSINPKSETTQIVNAPNKLELPQKLLKSESTQTEAAPMDLEFQKTEIIAETDDNQVEDNDDVFEDQDDDDELNRSIQGPGYNHFLEQYPEIAQDYIDKFLKQSPEIDYTYGLRHDLTTDTWTMGIKKLDFTSDGDIKVGDVTYMGTPGLYDLLFLRKPTANTPDDDVNFKDILQRTNVMRRNFSPSEQIKGSRASKYVNVIKPLFDKPRSPFKKSQSSDLLRRSFNLRSNVKSTSGSALLEYNEKRKEYVYYDDVNELVERLFKLDASKEAGNTNNMNEIISILEELSELGVIELYE